MSESVAYSAPLAQLIDLIATAVAAKLAANQPTPPIELLTTEELAAAVKLSRDVIDREAKAGNIPSVMIGARRRFVLADVIAALEAKPAKKKPDELGNVVRLKRGGAMIQALSLDAIKTEESAQCRTAIDEAIVADYAVALEGGATLPPIVVFFDGTDYWLADGHYRTLAHHRANRTEIACDVRDGGQREAILFACGANADHGQPRTNADKRKAVLTLLADPEWSKESDRWIAKAAKVSHPFVAKLRSEASGNVTAAKRLVANIDRCVREENERNAEILSSFIGAGDVARPSDAWSDQPTGDMGRIMVLPEPCKCSRCSGKAAKGTSNASIDSEIKRLGGSSADIALLTPPDGYGRTIQLDGGAEVETVFILPSSAEGFYHFAYLVDDRSKKDAGGSVVSTRRPVNAKGAAVGWLLDVPLSFRMAALRGEASIIDSLTTPRAENPFWVG